MRKLAMLNAAVVLGDLRTLHAAEPMEALAGDRGTAQHPHQRPVARLLQMDRRGLIEAEIVDYH